MKHQSASRIVSVFVVLVISTVPAFAQQKPSGDHQTSRWIGLAAAAAGTAVAVLGTTAFKSDKTASGNTPVGSFQACEALRVNPVYAGNQCDVLKGPNRPMVWSGVAIAGAGLTILAVTSTNQTIAIGPRGIRFTRRLSF